VRFDVSVLKNSKMVRIARYGNAGPGPKGTVMSVVTRLAGREFFALNGGPQLAFSRPSRSS